MTYSVRQQLRRVRRLRYEARPPRVLVVLLEEGDEENEQLRQARAQFRPGDTIVIRETPKGYLRGLLATQEEYEEAHGRADRTQRAGATPGS